MFPAASSEQEVSAEGALLLPEEADARGDAGGGLDHEPPTLRPSWFRRTRETLQGSVWAPVALKLAGLLLGVLVLSGVGIVSIVSSSSGAQVSLAGMLGSDVHAAWLASKPTANATTGNSASVASASATVPNAPAASANGGATSATNAPEAKTDAAATGSKSSGGMTSDGRVILNLAAVEDLRHLPGVGQKRADAILALRARLGGHFKHVNDLLRVKGIGVRGLKKILPHVVLDPPAVPAV